MKPSWILCLGAPLVLAACGSVAKEQAAPAPASPNVIAIAPDSGGVQTIAVQRQAVPDYLEIPGKIEPDPTSVIHVYPPLGGRVVSIAIRPGDHVHKGQELALLDSGDVAAARSDFQKAHADEELKQKALDRAKDLFEHQAIPEKDYQQAQADLLSAKAELARVQTQLKVLGLSENDPSGRMAVVSPRDAVVLDVGAAPGEFSKSLDAPAPLCTLANLETVWALGDVFEKDLVGLKAGTAAEVTANAYPTQKWEGRVGNIGDAVDANTRTLKLRVVLANGGEKLKPEMFVSIRVLRSTFEGIAVPTSAVLRESSGPYVFVQTAPGQFAKRDVATGRSIGAFVEVKSGLQAGETIVVDGALLIRASGS